MFKLIIISLTILIAGLTIFSSLKKPLFREVESTRLLAPRPTNLIVDPAKNFIEEGYVEK